MEVCVLLANSQSMAEESADDELFPLAVARVGEWDNLHLPWVAQLLAVLSISSLG